MPDTTTTAAPPDFLQYSPQDVMDHASKAGWTPEQTATALRKHRDNIAAYALDNEDASTGWKALHRLDVDTEHQLQQVRAMAGGAAVAQVLPDDNERAQFAAQLEAGGYDPGAVDEQWQPAVQAWTQAANNPAFALPARGKPRKFMLGDQHLGSYSEAPRSDGQSDHWFQPVSQDPATPMQPFSVRLPTVTDDEVKAELDKKQQELNDAADKWGIASEKLRKDEGSVAERDKWQEKTKQARAELDALKAHGRDMLTEQRLRTELADPKYAGKVGEYHGMMEAGKDLVHAVAGVPALFARDYDILASQPFLNSPLDTLRKIRSQGLATGLAGSVSGDMDRGALRKVNEVVDTINTGVFGDGASTRRDMEGGGWNETVRGIQATPALYAQMAMGGVGMMASVAGEREMEAQKRIDAAIAAGDYQTAKRLEDGRDLHAVLSGVLMGTAGKALRAVPGVSALAAVRGPLGVALNTAVGAGEMKAIGMAQRGLVDPIVGDHPDVLGGWSELAQGALLSLGTQGVHRVMNGPRPADPRDAYGYDTTPRQTISRDGLEAIANARMAELQAKTRVDGYDGSKRKTGDHVPANMVQAKPDLTPAEQAELNLLQSHAANPDAHELAKAYGLQIGSENNALLAGADPTNSANVTEGSPTEAQPGSPASEVARDAGSTPAVGALNPGDVHPENGKTVEAVMTGADGVRHLAYTDGTSESIAPNSKSPAPEEAAQNAAVEAALAGGPKSMMDVATRAGQVDSPRLQFAKGKDLRPDFAAVRPGDPVRSIKKHLPREEAPMPRLDPKLSESDSRVAVAQVLTQNPVVTDAQGKRVLLANPERNSLDTRVTHLTGSHDRVNDPEKKGPRIFNPNKASAAPAIPETVQNYHVKAYDPTTKTFLYLRNYKDGLHAVFTDANGQMTDHGQVDTGLLSHRATKSASETFTRFHVVDTKTPASDLQTPDKMQASQTQKAARTPPPQGNSESRLQESKSKVEAAVPLNERVQNTTKVATEAARLLNQQLPGIVHSKVDFHANPEELLKSGYAGEHTFTPKEIADMQNAEAFFDTRTGHTIIFTDHIDVRPGESERAAVARVILHERVGHDGFNHLYERSPEFAGTWGKLSKQIPDTELSTIAADYPHLAGDKGQLALEWFARQVERIAGERAGAKMEPGLKGLLKQMWEALKTLYTHVFAPFSQSLRTERDLRDLIDKATDAARNGTAIPTTAEGLRLQFSLGGTRVSHKDGEPFRVNDLGTRTILTGSALPKAFHEAVQSTERERRALDQVSAQIGRDLNTAIEAHAKRAGKPLTDVYDMVHQAMSGAPGMNAVLLAIDPTLAERARVARNFIDDMSVAVAQTLPAGPLRNNIVLNQGAWMKRSYAAFDAASGWNYDNVLKAARAGEQLAGKPAEQIVRDAAKLLAAQGKYPAAMLDAKGLPVDGTPLESDLRDLMDRDTFANALTGSAAVRKNVSSLIARKDMPAELRALMGEDTNPIKRFANSTAFQVQFLQRHAQQQTLRTIGLGNGLFSTTRGGVNTVQIPENHKWSPLAGLHTTPQLWEALQRVDGTERGNDFLAKMGEAVRWLGGEAKLNRVAMNPDSWAVNALGNVFALAQTGDLFSTTIFSRLSKAVGLMRAGRAKSGDVINATTEAITDAQREMVARLNAAGVLGETFSARDLEASLPRHLLQWIDQDASGLRNRSVGALKGAVYGQAAGRGFGLTGRAVGGAVGAIAGAVAGHERILGLQKRIAEYVMTGPDALGRLTGFLGNLETAHAAGLTLQAAFDHAAERTRNTFPDYSKLPNVLRQMSKYGVAGSFVAFQYEVYRNTAWNLRYAYQDAKSGNTALQVRAAKRLLGASMLGYLAFGGTQAMFQQVVGADDDRNKTWRRWFAAPWEKHSVLAFTDYSDKGVSYFNTSYLVPQTTIAQLVKAATDGSDLGEAAGNVLGEAWAQFMGASVHIQPLIEAAMNVDRAGRPITFNDGIVGALERADHAAQTILEPGWAGKIERLEYALREAERRGRTFSVEEEIKRFIGIRSFTRTWPDMVKRRYDKFAHDYSAIRSEANKTIGNNLPGAKLEAIATANAKIAALEQELAEYDAALPRLGVPTRLQETARKDSTVPKTFHPLEVDPETGNRVRSRKGP